MTRDEARAYLLSVAPTGGPLAHIIRNLSDAEMDEILAPMKPGQLEPGQLDKMLNLMATTMHRKMDEICLQILNDSHVPGEGSK